MRKRIKSTLLVAAGLCWLAAALFIVALLYQYLTEGAGLQVLGFFTVSSTTILTGLGHVIGFSTATLICLILGIMFCAHGLSLTKEEQDKTTLKPADRFALYRHAFADRSNYGNVSLSRPPR